jgi:nucleotide-binding universal stress UspA family protein
MTIKNILVPTDFSENARLAFEKSLDLARQVGAKVHLLHVQDESTLRTAIKEGLLHGDSTDEQLQVDVDRLTEARFTTLLGEHAASAIEIAHLVRRGEADVAIIQFAREIDADLVVVGLRGAGLMGRIRTVMMGSVAESVINKSPCPVLVVRLEHK